MNIPFFKRIHRWVCGCCTSPRLVPRVLPAAHLVHLNEEVHVAPLVNDPKRAGSEGEHLAGRSGLCST